MVRCCGLGAPTHALGCCGRRTEPVWLGRRSPLGGSKKSHLSQRPENFAKSERSDSLGKGCSQLSDLPWIAFLRTRMLLLEEHIPRRDTLKAGLGLSAPWSVTTPIQSETEEPSASVQWSEKWKPERWCDWPSQPRLGLDWNAVRTVQGMSRE